METNIPQQSLSQQPKRAPVWPLVAAAAIVLAFMVIGLVVAMTHPHVPACADDYRLCPNYMQPQVPHKTPPQRLRPQGQVPYDSTGVKRITNQISY